MKYSKYERGLIQFGFELARENAWISEHDGWHVTSPTIDWGRAERELERELALDEK